MSECLKSVAQNRLFYSNTWRVDEMPMRLLSSPVRASVAAVRVHNSLPGRYMFVVVVVVVEIQSTKQGYFTFHYVDINVEE